MAVADLQEEISSEEFTRILAYDRIEPFSWEMENWRFANLASAVVNAIRLSVPRGTRKLTQPSDFYPVLKHGPTTTLTYEQQAFIEKRKKRGARNRRKDRDRR